MAPGDNTIAVNKYINTVTAGYKAGSLPLVTPCFVIVMCGYPRQLMLNAGKQCALFTTLALLRFQCLTIQLML